MEKGKIVLSIKDSKGNVYEIYPCESEEFIDNIFWNENDAEIDFTIIKVGNKFMAKVN
jgi:hypothetical protein